MNGGATALRLPVGNFFMLLFYGGLLTVALFDVLSPHALLIVAMLVVGYGIVQRIGTSEGLPPPVLFFEIGFLLVVVNEGLSLGDTIAANVGPPYFREAVRVLVAGMAVVMLTRELFGLRFGTAPPQRTPGPYAPLPGGLLIGLYAVALYALIPAAQASMAAGRIGYGAPAGPSLLGPLVQAVTLPVSILTPVLITYTVCLVRGRSLFRAYLWSAPILACLFLIGTRYTLLIAAVAPLFVDLARQGRAKGFYKRATLGGVILAVLFGAMLTFRAQGASNVGVVESIKEGASNAASSEGVISMTAQMDRYFQTHPHRDGQSALGTVTFYVPRALWPGKPLLLGAWFPITAQGQSPQSGNSISAGFPGDGYADGGFEWMLVWCAMLGVAIGVLDRWAVRTVLQGKTPVVILAACLYPGMFFAVRSPTTTLVALSGVAVVVWAVGRLARRDAHRATVGDRQPVLRAVR